MSHVTCNSTASILGFDIFPIGILLVIHHRLRLSSSHHHVVVSSEGEQRVFSHGFTASNQTTLAAFLSADHVFIQGNYFLP